MPAVAKTSDVGIVDAARDLIAQHGIEEISLGRVSAAVGIKAPSLYKRFADRAALIAAVREDVLRQLGKALTATATHRDPVKQAKAMAWAYRKFALRNQRLYPLIQPAGGAISESAKDVIAPVLDTLRDMVGEDHALPAARCLTAFLHGFVAMEIGGSFQLGGSLDSAFEFGLDAILRGLGPPRLGGRH